MRIALLSVLIAQLVMSASARALPELAWWVAPPTMKVRPGDPVPVKFLRQANLHAARNEFEAFQIVLRSTESVLDVDVVAEIPSITSHVYLVGNTSVTRPSREHGEIGDWPDPLLPRVDSYYQEKRKAFPFSITSRRNQAVWIDLYVPKGTRAGAHEGRVKVLVGGAEVAIIPIQLTVWNFELPSTSSLANSFGFNGLAALKQHVGKYTSDDDVRDISALYAKAALLHRLSLHGGTLIPPPFTMEGNRAVIDWREYDKELGPFMDGTVLSGKDPLPGARYTTIDLRTHGSADSDSQKMSYWREWARHFREKGWFDRLFYYVKDEPEVKAYPEVSHLAILAHEADPDIKTLVTVQRTRELEGRVDVWTPLINCFETRPGFDGFCREMVPRSGYDSEIKKGKRLWWYQSCGSHGCNIEGGPYFKGWPSYMVDDSGVSNRIMPWLAWKYRVSGELYFSMNDAYSQLPDPWKSIYLFGGNGDGTLFYPGNVSRVGGMHDIPIESIRLKLIREGLEDYEYLVLLRNPAADSHVAHIVQSLYQFDSDPDKLEAERLRMGEDIVGHAGTGAK